jgi:transposase
MTSPVAGIDPHQTSITVGMVDGNGTALDHRSFTATAAGYLEAIEFLNAHSVQQVGIEGSASWGAHAAIALTAAGFDCRQVPAQRSAAQRRARRSDNTDTLDAIAAARALLTEPTLGPLQTLEMYDPLAAKIDAVLEHHRMLVAVRTLTLHHVQDQITKLPVEIRDQLRAAGKIKGRLRRLEQLTKSVIETALGKEMTDHLGYEKHDPAGIGAANIRNGSRAKTVITDALGPVEIDVPRDRAGTFERQIVKKRQRRLGGVDEIVLSLYAKGLTTGEISAHFAEIYGASVSKETISRITDRVVEEMQAWQARPLDEA